MSLADASTDRRWWWIRALLLYTVAAAAVLAAYLLATPDGVILVAVGAVLLLLYAMFSTLGYRPLRPDERAFLEGTQLHHYSAAPYETFALDGGDASHVTLDPARCRLNAIMIRSDRPWTRPRRAAYCFLGPAHASVAKYNVAAARQRTLIVIEGANIVGPILVRGDGALALPEGYSGPASVINLA